MERTTSPPERRADWARPLRVLRLARRVGVGPWGALAWLEAVLLDFEAQAEEPGEASGDGLPWPPGD